MRIGKTQLKTDIYLQGITFFFCKFVAFRFFFKLLNVAFKTAIFFRKIYADFTLMNFQKNDKDICDFSFFLYQIDELDFLLDLTYGIYLNI